MIPPSTGRPCRSESCDIEEEHEEHEVKKKRGGKASATHHGELSPEFRAYLEKRWGRELPKDGALRPVVNGWEWVKYPASKTWRLRKVRGGS